MSTPKFLTWSKGQQYSKEDSKHVSSGIVPIPVECISLKGMDYGRSEKRLGKMKRRPMPLEFGKSEHSNGNSFALHDAAIKSATTLMAVMNDVLQSPHLNAHFHSQQSGGLQPTPQGRPRSRTAPSTPLFEAAGVEPVELPGSFPVWPNSYHDGRQSMDTVSSRQESVGRSIDRPHSSPQPSSSFAFKGDHVQPRLTNSRGATNVRITASHATYNRRSSTSSDRQNSSSGLALLVPEKNISSLDTMSAVHGAPHVTSRSPRGESVALHGTENIAPGPHVQTNKISLIPDELPAPTDLKALLEQVSAMRRSHDAHVLSLKQEVESHKSYIAFLESCPVPVAESQESSRPGLTLDTSHITGKISRMPSTEINASTLLQSFDPTPEALKRASVESAAAEAEAEALKRKLSLCRKTQSELSDVRRERDHFRDANNRNERRMVQLKDLVRKSKDTDIAMKNKVRGLEAALLAANTQRVDVLEGYREACEQVRRLHDKQLVTIRERDEAVAGVISAPGRKRVASKGGEEAKIANESNRHQARTEDATLPRQLEALRRLLSEKDLHIQKLKAERQNCVPKADMSKVEERLTDAEAVRDQYNDLLHTELRRQSKNVALSTHEAMPRVMYEAAAMVFEKINAKSRSENPDSRCEFLEKELTHCVSEIILYKLDIQGYRKDLKEANAKIEGLQRSRPHRPETPDSLENISGEKSASPGGRCCRAASGLGLDITQRTNTPTRLSASRLSSNASTPLELDKKLPKPPSASRSPSPNPAPLPTTTTDLTRAETVRSLSESIISSYAKRATPEQDHGHVPPLSRGRSSDQPRSSAMRVDSSSCAIDAIAVPISRYTRDMLKTPNNNMVVMTSDIRRNVLRR